MRSSKAIRAVVASAVTAAMLGGGLATAHAVDKPGPLPPAAVESEAMVRGIPFSTLTNQGYTVAEIEAAVAQSPYVSIVEGPVPGGLPKGTVSTQGVTLGKWIYVRVSQATAKAILAGSSAAAVGLLGLATGGIGAVIGGAIYAYVTSLGTSGLSKCARWEFRLNYPVPFFPMQIRAAKCI